MAQRYTISTLGDTGTGQAQLVQTGAAILTTTVGNWGTPMSLSPGCQQLDGVYQSTCEGSVHLRASPGLIVRRSSTGSVYTALIYMNGAWQKQSGAQVFSGLNDVGQIVGSNAEQNVLTTSRDPAEEH